MAGSLRQSSALSAEVGRWHQSPAPRKVTAPSSALPSTVQLLAQHDAGCDSVASQIAAQAPGAVGISILCLLILTGKAQGCGSILANLMAQAWGELSGAGEHLLLATEHLQRVV